MCQRWGAEQGLGGCGAGAARLPFPCEAGVSWRGAAPRRRHRRAQGDASWAAPQQSAGHMAAGGLAELALRAFRAELSFPGHLGRGTRVAGCGSRAAPGGAVGLRSAPGMGCSQGHVHCTSCPPCSRLLPRSLFAQQSRRGCEEQRCRVRVPSRAARGAGQALPRSILLFPIRQPPLAQEEAAAGPALPAAPRHKERALRGAAGAWQPRGAGSAMGWESPLPWQAWSRERLRS